MGPMLHTGTPSHASPCGTPRNAQPFITTQSVPWRYAQAFWQWRDAVRAIKFRARQRALARHSLLLSPVFQRALLNVRRMTLAVSSDTNGTWRKLPGR